MIVDRGNVILYQIVRGLVPAAYVRAYTDRYVTGFIRIAVAVGAVNILCEVVLSVYAISAIGEVSMTDAVCRIVDAGRYACSNACMTFSTEVIFGLISGMARCK